MYLCVQVATVLFGSCKEKSGRSLGMDEGAGQS
jgi:hypothetical protein